MVDVSLGPEEETRFLLALQLLAATLASEKLQLHFEPQ